MAVGGEAGLTSIVPGLAAILCKTSFSCVSIFSVQLVFHSKLCECEDARGGRAAGWHQERQSSSTCEAFLAGLHLVEATPASRR